MQSSCPSVFVIARNTAKRRRLHSLAQANPFNAFTHLNSEAASPGSDGPLKDWRIAVKDNFCTNDMPTTCASNVLAGYQAPYEATVVSQLRKAGGHIVGKTNMDEFGMGSLNKHSSFGPVINPVSSADNPRSAGGSSGGSAAAVASGACRLALGTDTGGSTRLPAAYCGIVGFKPSYGLLSRHGLIAYASSLDCVGLMATNVDDVEKAFGILNHEDEQDPTAIATSFRSQAAIVAEESSSKLSSSLEHLRIGIPAEYCPKELNTETLESFRRVIKQLRERGAQITSVNLPTTPYTLSAYYVLSSAEAASNLAKFDGVRYGYTAPFEDPERKLSPSLYAASRSVFGSEVKKRILLGNHALSAGAFDNYYLQAQAVRRMIRDDFDHVFRQRNVLNLANADVSNPENQVDLLLYPSAVSTAPLLNLQSQTLDEYTQDIMNVPASLAGLPAISLPAGKGKDGGPLGVQLAGQWGMDTLLLHVAKVVQDIDLQA